VAAHPFLGLRDHQARILADGIGLAREHIPAFIKIAKALYKAYLDVDASLAEINPLVVTGDNRLVALDGKIAVDDSALFRHPEIAEMRDPAEENAAEQEANRFGLTFIHLDGEIGCMVNGAGLAMATMDIVKLYGGEPANFLDIGGGAQADKVAAALRIILADRRVKAVLINIFGGITRCDEVARGVLQAIGTLEVTVPFVVRLVGTNEEEGRRILAEANLITATSLADAAQKAVAAAQGKEGASA
jgi:succinyl-CoA synthetase beta subunit